MDKHKMTFVRLIWRGQSHEAAGFTGHTKHGNTVTIFRAQFPPGYGIDEPTVGQLTIQFGEFCVHPDSSGEYESICTKTVDLDEMEKLKDKQ